MGRNPIIGGSGMAVLLGTTLFLGIVFSGGSLTLLQKLGLAAFSILMIFVGLIFSKG